MIDAQQENNVSEAFSKQSPFFDDIDKGNSIIGWMRGRVRAEVLRYIELGSEMLELNCGTGIDSVFFAQKGFRVLATDNAEGMLLQLDNKIELLKLHENLTTQRCSFNNLEQLQPRRFDYVFSNFGGLNCTDNLQKVLTDIDAVLKPGGYFTLVIMPVVCPWEIFMLFKGYFKTAFRRFKKSGTMAHLEGVHFKCYYYNPSYITKRLSSQYELVSLKGLSIVVPPPYIEHFREKHSSVFSLLEKIENRIWNRKPFNRWCDHYMITMKKK